MTFLQRYLPRFYRAEHRTHATLVICGKLSNLRRKTSEPIAARPASTASPSSPSSAPAVGRRGRHGRVA